MLLWEYNLNVLTKTRNTALGILFKCPNQNTVYCLGRYYLNSPTNSKSIEYMLHLCYILMVWRDVGIFLLTRQYRKDESLVYEMSKYFDNATCLGITFFQLFFLKFEEMEPRMEQFNPTQSHRNICLLFTSYMSSVKRAMTKVKQHAYI